MSIKAFFAKIEERLSAEDDFITKSVGFVSKKTGVARSQVLIGLVVILFWLFLWQNGMELISLIVGFTYPMYMSFKAIESSSKADDTQWLTYWVVFSAFNFAEYFIDLILWWFPFYYIAKIGFLVWCMAPIENNGSVVLYNQIIRKFFFKYEDKIDGALKQAASSGAKLAKEVASEAAKDANPFGYKFK